MILSCILQEVRYFKCLLSALGSLSVSWIRIELYIVSPNSKNNVNEKKAKLGRTEQSVVSFKLKLKGLGHAILGNFV